MVCLATFVSPILFELWSAELGLLHMSSQGASHHRTSTLETRQFDSTSWRDEICWHLSCSPQRHVSHLFSVMRKILAAAAGLQLLRSSSAFPLSGYCGFLANQSLSFRFQILPYKTEERGCSCTGSNHHHAMPAGHARSSLPGEHRIALSSFSKSGWRGWCLLAGHDGARSARDSALS